MISIISKSFKTKTPKKFRYVPRYYNERKEKLEERILLHQQSEEPLPEAQDDPEYRMTRAERMRKQVNFKTQKKPGIFSFAESRNSAFRVMLILAGLCVLTLFLLRKYGIPLSSLF
jgi:hypothetical protein